MGEGAKPEALFLKVPELAALLGIDEMTVRRWIGEGLVPAACIKRGGTQLVPRSWLDNLLASVLEGNRTEPQTQMVAVPAQN